MEIPGYMSRGNWTAGLFIDKRASIYAVKAMTRIFTGKAGGTTSLLSILVGKFLGVEQVPITYETRDKTRIFQIPKIIDGAVTPIRRQGSRQRHRDQQFGILDRAGDHRGQVRQEPDARLRPQLEFRRPLGRNMQAGLARTRETQRKVTWPQASAFSVHLLTASGSFLAFLSLVAASEERWTAMFWWLGLALFVDGIDGPIARKLEVKEILPTWSGELLDNIIDYVTYVLIPAFALYQRGLDGRGAVVPVGGDHRGVERDLLCRHRHEDEGELLQGVPGRLEHGRLHAVRHRAGPMGVVRRRGDRRHPDLRAGQFPASGSGRSGCGRSISA